LEEGESWALVPRRSRTHPGLWTPGIKWDVPPGGYTHVTEFFGPVLGVMRYESLAEAIALVNQTGYGLTSAIESLDERERSEWKAGIRAGNLYLNRGTTGALVLRQPFGGFGKSAFGPGLKAGGPNYVAPLMRFREAEGFREAADYLSLSVGYRQVWRSEFGLEHDSFRLVGQENVRRYLPVHGLVIRLDPRDSDFEIL